MIRNVALVCVVLILLAAAIYVIDLCLQAVFNRLTVSEDIKTAARALLAFVIFAMALLWVLSLTGVLPQGWW